MISGRGTIWVKSLERKSGIGASSTYARINLAFERGDGAWLTSTEGERFLDFGGGIAVASLGYGHPHLVKALHEQGAKIWHVPICSKSREAERLAQRLVEVSFADYVFFTNSGAEAVEGAIKTARKYQSAGGHPEKFRIITFAGAFHGRTLATIAAAGNPKYLEGFGPRVEGFDTVPFGDIGRSESRDRSANRRHFDRANSRRRRHPRRAAGLFAWRYASFATRTGFF